MPGWYRKGAKGRVDVGRGRRWQLSPRAMTRWEPGDDPETRRAKAQYEVNSAEVGGWAGCGQLVVALVLGLLAVFGWLRWLN